MFKKLRGFVVGIVFIINGGLLFAENKDVNYTVGDPTGTYANSGYRPQAGAVLDRQGNAHSQVEEHWQQTITPSVYSTCGDITVSTISWTAVPSTNTIAVDRKLLWLDLYNTNSSSALVRITTQTLTVGATDQGMTMAPADTPWEIPVSSRTWIWIYGKGTTPEKANCRELTYEKAY